VTPAATAGSLVGTAAIVTGAGHGLGRAYATGLAERGASVVVADLDADAAAAVAGKRRASC
jgi:NAD(P)-dependent dehydrogenase (short-subunit alcohol dehydrogenase family)